MPGEVRGHLQDELVEDGAAAPHAQRRHHVQPCKQIIYQGLLNHPVCYSSYPIVSRLTDPQIMLYSRISNLSDGQTDANQREN